MARHAHEQLEVRRAEVKDAAFDAALGVAEHGIAAGAAKTDADLVRKDLLGGAHLLERLGVQDFAELSQQELVREHRELDEKRAGLLGAEIALLEPRGVGVRADDGVLEHVALEPRLEAGHGMPHGNQITLRIASVCGQSGISIGWRCSGIPLH